MKNKEELINKLKKILGTGFNEKDESFKICGMEISLLNDKDMNVYLEHETFSVDEHIDFDAINDFNDLHSVCANLEKQHSTWYNDVMK